MLSIFKDYNSNWRPWIVLTTEFLGTFLLVLGIIIPSVFGFKDASLHNNQASWLIVERLWNIFAISALYVAVLVASLYLLFGKISANLNPAVTIVEMCRRKDKVWLGLSKIVIQFGGAFVATYMAWLFMFYMKTWNPVSASGATLSALDGVTPQLTLYAWPAVTNVAYPAAFTIQVVNPRLFNVDRVWYQSTTAVIEAVLTFSLLAVAFWWKPKNFFWRAMLILFGLWIIVAIGERFNTIALNPARLIAPAITTWTQGGSEAAIQNIYPFIAGEIFAAVIFGIIEFTRSSGAEKANAILKDKEKFEDLAATREIALKWLNDERLLRTLDKKTLREKISWLGLNPSKQATKKDLVDILKSDELGERLDEVSRVRFDDQSDRRVGKVSNHGLSKGAQPKRWDLDASENEMNRRLAEVTYTGEDQLVDKLKQEINEQKIIVDENLVDTLVKRIRKILQQETYDFEVNDELVESIINRVGKELRLESSPAKKTAAKASKKQSKQDLNSALSQLMKK